MNRIVVNKHFSNSSAITYNSFGQSTGYVGKGAPALGEIIVCNEAGYEGIYILNTAHQAIRIGAWTGDIEADLDRLKRELKEEIEQWAEEQFASQAEIDNLQQQIDAIVITPIDEGRVREIANEEISKIVDSATTYNTLYKIEQWIVNSGGTVDEGTVREIAMSEVNKVIGSASTDFNTLGKIENWIINSASSVDPQLKADVEYLKSISAETRLDALESVSADTRLNEIEAVSAETRIHRLEDKIDGISKSTDHFVMTYQQYQQLIASGSVVVDGELVIYKDDNFYCIYEGEGPNPEPTPTPSSGTVILSGDTVIFNENYYYDDTDEEFSIYIGEIEDSGNGVIIVDWPIGEGDDDDSEFPSEGDIINDNVVINESVYNDGSQSEEPNLEIGVNDIDENGIVDTDWVIEEK